MFYPLMSVKSRMNKRILSLDFYKDSEGSSVTTMPTVINIIKFHRADYSPFMNSSVTTMHTVTKIHSLKIQY